MSVVDNLTGFAPDVRGRLERMFSFERPLQPLDDLSLVPTLEGWTEVARHQDGNGEWPYEHVPGERCPIDEPSPVALEDVQEDFL